jgi:hypothetical protein
MSNSDAPSCHYRKPGNDDAELHCRDANSIRVFLHAFQESLPRTDGRPMSLLPKDVFAPQRGRRSAERRTNSSCRASMGRRSRGPINKRDRSPFGAPPRSCAGKPDSAWAALPGTTGCKREDPLRHPCSEHLAVRHAPDGLIPKPPAGQERRTPPAGTAPAPSVGVTG